MSTMDSNVLHHPIKFSIKTNDLEKLKKKPDKSFFKIDVLETEVDDSLIKEAHTKQVVSIETSVQVEEALKGRPLICDNVMSEKVKRTTKRTIQSDLDHETIKHRKIDDKDQVIIEPETSSALVIRGLPRSVAPIAVSKEQSILQIFSKYKDVITDKLEEKIDLIDRLCQSGSCDISLSKDALTHDSKEGGKKVNLKPSYDNKEIPKMEKSSKSFKSDKTSIHLKDLKVAKVTHKLAKMESKAERCEDLKDDGSKKFVKSKLHHKTRDSISKSKIISPEKIQSKVENSEKKFEVSISNHNKEVTKDKFRDLRPAELQRSTHRIGSSNKNQRSSKRYSPLKSDLHNITNKTDNRRISDTRSTDHHRHSHSKSPRKSRSHNSKNKVLKRHKSARSLQMGPLSLRDEFLLETERVIVNPVEQLEESFKCKTTKAPVKDKRYIEERLQRLFNKTKSIEEKEATDSRVIVEQPSQQEKGCISSFLPVETLNQESTVTFSMDNVSFKMQSSNIAPMTHHSFAIESQIGHMFDKMNRDNLLQTSHEKVSFAIPICTNTKSRPISIETDTWCNPKTVSKSLLSEQATQPKQVVGDSTTKVTEKSPSNIESETMVSVSKDSGGLSLNILENKEIVIANDGQPFFSKEPVNLEEINEDHKVTSLLSQEKNQYLKSSHNDHDKKSLDSTPAKQHQNKKHSHKNSHKEVVKKECHKKDIVAENTVSTNLVIKDVNKTQLSLTSEYTLSSLETSPFLNPVTESPIIEQIVVESQTYTSPKIVSVLEKPAINSWAQESSQRPPKEEFFKDESNRTECQNASRGKVSFMISPRKVIKTTSAMTMTPKLPIPKELPIICNENVEKPKIISDLQSGDKETIKTTELIPELIAIEPEVPEAIVEKSVQNVKKISLETSNDLFSHDTNDLNLFFINNRSVDRKLEEDSRPMHIEKTVIMEPQGNMCNILFRIKNDEKQNQVLLQGNEMFSTLENRSKEMIEIKLKNEQDSPMMLSLVLDNLIQSESLELSKSKKVDTQESPVEKFCSNMDADKFFVSDQLDSIHLVHKSKNEMKKLELKSKVRSNDLWKSHDKSSHSNSSKEENKKNSSKLNELSKKEMKSLQNLLDSPKDLTHLSKHSKNEDDVSVTSNLIDENKNVQLECLMKIEQLKNPILILPENDKNPKVENKITESKATKWIDPKENVNQIELTEDLKSVYKNLDNLQTTILTVKDSKPLDSRVKSIHLAEQATKSSEHLKSGKEVRSRSKPTKTDEYKQTSFQSSKNGSKQSKDRKIGKDDHVKSQRKYRDPKRNSRSKSNSSIFSRKSGLGRAYFSPNRRQSRDDYNYRSKNKQKDYKRSFRSRSKYSKKRKSSRSRSIHRRKSINREKRRQRSSSDYRHRSTSSRYSNVSKNKYRRKGDNCDNKRRSKHSVDRHKSSNDRFRYTERSSRSPAKYSGKRKVSKSRSCSRKKLGREKKANSKSYSSTDSISSKNKSNSNKYDTKLPIKEKNLKSKEPVRSEKSKEKSKSQDKQTNKVQSNLLQVTSSTNDQKPMCSVKESFKANAENKSTGSTSDEKNLTYDNEPGADEKAAEKLEEQSKVKVDPIVVKENCPLTMTPAEPSDIKITIKERTCAEKCMLSFVNRNIPNIVNIKQPITEIPKIYKPDVSCNQIENQQYYPLQQPSMIASNDRTSNMNYFMNSHNYHQPSISQQPTYPNICNQSSALDNYSTQSIYQQAPYSNFYQSQPQPYPVQSFENYAPTYPHTTMSMPPYVAPKPDTRPVEIKNAITPVSLTSQWNNFDCSVNRYNMSTYQTPLPPPPPTPPIIIAQTVATSKPSEEDSFCQTRNSSISSLSNSLIDMDIVSQSNKSQDSNVGLKLGDVISNNDDLSSCDEFEFEDFVPQDPFQKYADAPRPEYEHIIKTEVHVSAVGKRFEYAYLKSTSCNCIPPNPDEIRMGKAACDENCFNRKIKVECSRHCPVYELCTNRRFQEQIYSQIEPFYVSADKGWGIRSLGNIPAGTFVIEYVGELIDSNEFFRRIHQQTTQNHHFMMVIQKDMYIDASNKGNWARFVNHSCDPNMIIERWVVNGKTRIGFFSMKPIAKDEEVTIDYQFQQYGSVEQKCFCASSNCTGIMGKVNEKLQEQIKMSATRHTKELIQRIISRKLLKEINHVSEMITVIKDNALDRDTFFSFLEVLQRTSSHLCIRTFIECGGLNVITSYLDTISWNDWPLKLLYLQCLDHFKLKKRILINSGYTSATVVDYWCENPRYETKHVVEDALNINSFNDDSESVSDSLEPLPIANESPIEFSLPTTDETVDEIEKQVQTVAIKIKEYFAKEKEKFFIPKIKNNQIEFSNELSTNDSESKSISIASSVQGDFVQMKTKKLRNKCSEAIQKLSKEEFRRLFSERYKKSIVEKNQTLVGTEINDNAKNAEVYQRIKQILSNVITEEINNLKQSEQFSAMPLEFQNADIDKILASLNIVEKESLITLLTPQQDAVSKLGSLSDNSKSSEDTPKGEQGETPLINSDQLPPNWRFCRCDNGRIYFYHTITKKTQWETPIYPWDAGDDDPSSYDFGNAHEYQVSVDDVKCMLQRYKLDYKEEKLRERQRRRIERTLQRKLSLSTGERNKIQFSREVFKAVKALMKPYFSSSCKVGRVKSKPDLKFLCEKFADTIILKEVKLVANLEDLELNSDVNSRIVSYVTKYMTNQGRLYKRSKKLKIKPKNIGESVGSSMSNFSF